MKARLSVARNAPINNVLSKLSLYNSLPVAERLVLTIGASCLDSKLAGMLDVSLMG